MLAAGYCFTTCPTIRANSSPERLGVAVVNVAAGLRFPYAKYFGHAAPVIFIVLFRWFSRLGRYRRTYIIVQRDRFFIQANDGLPLVALQQNPDCFAAHLGHRFALDGFFHNQAHRPPRPAFRRLTANHGNDALLLGKRRAPHGPLAAACRRGRRSDRYCCSDGQSAGSPWE